VTACLGAERPFFSTYVEGSDVESGAIRRWAPAESVALRCVASDCSPLGRCMRAWVCVCVFFFCSQETLVCMTREERVCGTLVNCSFKSF
jgi:hypothetical protein